MDGLEVVDQSRQLLAELHILLALGVGVCPLSPLLASEAETHTLSLWRLLGLELTLTDERANQRKKSHDWSLGNWQTHFNVL